MKKKWLAGFLAATMIVASITGCGKEGNNSEQQNTESNVNTDVNNEQMTNEITPPLDVTQVPEATSTPKLPEPTPEALYGALDEARIAQATSGEMREISTMDLVWDMGIGINLGNTFESCGDWIKPDKVSNYEKGWGSPVIMPYMIEGYAKSGFGVLRIPVAWSNMMQENYTIHPEYMARVKEVVEMALNSGLYVVLNIHWDGGWWEDFAVADKKDECMTKYTRIWEQIAEEFRDYGDYLMFESLNEEGCWNSLWNRYGSGNKGKEEAYGLLNEINQTFVNIVRESGGNNAKRHLLIAGYATDVELTCDEAFKMPQDEMNRCAVSVHYYTPSTFAILDADASWGKCSSTWGTNQEYKELEKNMDLMKTTYIDKGIPVIIGEYGCPKKNKEKESIHAYLGSVNEYAYIRGMCPVLWDVTNAQYSRAKGEFIDKELLGLLNAVKAFERAK